MSEKNHSAQQAIEVILESLRMSEKRIAELEAALAQRSPATQELQERLSTFEGELETLTRERDDWKFEYERMHSVAEDERKATQYLRRKLRISETGPEQAGKKELNYLRGRTEELEAHLKQGRAAAAELEQRLAERSQAASAALAAQAALQARAAELERELAHAAELRKELERLRKEAAAAQAELGQALKETAAAKAELGQARSEITAAQADRQQALDEIALARAETDSARAQAARSAMELEEQITQLRKADENLARTDNERRRLEEQVELDSERLHDLRDQVASLKITERWATRRRDLARRLIAEIRNRQRANMALKSGLDALRQNKQKAEQQQHLLLEKYRRLKASMHPRPDDDPEDHKRRLPSASHQLVAEEASGSGLHRRLLAQDELIESMERDIERVGAMKRALSERDKRLAEADARIEALQKELALKQELIGTLENDMQNTMRGRRIDPRLLSAETEEPPQPVGTPPEEQNRGLRTVDLQRHGKQDTGTLKLRALSDTGLADPPAKIPAAARRD